MVMSPSITKAAIRRRAVGGSPARRPRSYVRHWESDVRRHPDRLSQLRASITAARRFPAGELECNPQAGPVPLAAKIQLPSATRLAVKLAVKFEARWSFGGGLQYQA